jgi:beta-1,4-mannooligosaccharide/beta-1,4-mannosyl-N-acetylglucosamine phosphorylase
MIPVLVRSSDNPILTGREIPAMPPDLVDPSSVFNPGATRYGDRIVLLLRVQSRGRRTFLVPAESDDGRDFHVRDRLVEIRGLDLEAERILHVYDPRITHIGNDWLVMFAADTEAGCRLGVARTRDFERFELVGLGADPDVRNGVLFPARFDGRYRRLDRPNRIRLADGPTTGDEIVLSESDDLVTWRPLGTVLRGRARFWDERIGAGPPPVRTRRGWLLVYHGVATHFAGASLYQAGVALLDLDDPRKVVGRSRDNILEPRKLYEQVGQVPNVVFPSGMVVEEADAEGFAPDGARVLLYYGAADSCVCLAESTIGRLLSACDPVSGEGD